MSSGRRNAFPRHATYKVNSNYCSQKPKWQKRVDTPQTRLDAVSKREHLSYAFASKGAVEQLIKKHQHSRLQNNKRRDTAKQTCSTSDVIKHAIISPQHYNYIVAGKGSEAYPFSRTPIQSPSLSISIGSNPIQSKSMQPNPTQPKPVHRDPSPIPIRTFPLP